MADDENTQQSAKPKRTKGRKRRAAVYVAQFLGGLLLFLLIVGVAAMMGRNIDLPDWVVSEVETRLSAEMNGEAVNLQGVSIGLRDGAYRPTIELHGVEVLSAQNTSLLALPKLRTKLDTSELIFGRIAIETLELSGTQLELERDEDGKIVFALGADLGDGMQSTGSLSDALLQIDEFVANPMLRELEEIRADDLTLSLKDRRTGEVLSVKDGSLELLNLPNALALNVSFALDIPGAAPAELFFAADKAKGARGARLVAKFSNLDTRVLADQVGALTLLEVLDAPVAGALTTEIGEDGQIESLAGTLDISAGAVRPAEQAKPIKFNSAQTYVRYDRATQRVYLDQFNLDAPELRLEATGHTDLNDWVAGVPQNILGQVRLSNVRLDPEGIFENPVTFAKGALDLRYRSEDLRMDVGQLVLSDQGTDIVAHGYVGVGKEGWEVGLDANIGSIAQNRLLALWPVSAVDKTRGWLTQNISAGDLQNAAAALRLAPGRPFAASVTFDFDDAEVRYLKTLPAVRKGRGYVSILQNRFILALHDGIVTAPVGGDLNAGGSVMEIADVSKNPAVADIDLNVTGPLSAALSLMDEKPFEFLSKSDLKTDIAKGQVDVRAKLSVPLLKDVKLDQITYDVDADLLNVVSDKLVDGHVLGFQQMQLSAGDGALRIGGPGTIDDVPIDVTWSRALGDAGDKKSKIAGTIELSPRALKAFNIGLPDGSVTGSARANIDIALQRGIAPKAALSSSLYGLGLRIDALDWNKARDAKGDFQASLVLGETPDVTSISLAVAGLDATGAVTLKQGGGLDRAVFTPLKVSNRFNSRVEVVGQGAGRPVSLVIKGGTIDIRKFGVTDGKGNGGPPLDLALDRVIVTDGVALHGFRGKFRNDKGLDGTFQAAVNGQANVRGTVVPTRNGPAFRITSKNGGAVLKASGILKTANGGDMSLTMQPNGKAGQLDGTLKITGARVKKAPALADLLSALSVIGLLEQLSGDGIFFGQVDANFLLTPKGVRLKSSSAVGPSMGITMEGIYNTEQSRMDMQGVISPIYAVNGLFGRLFSPRKGEGLLGFNYNLQGAVENPRVTVNPLSLFTPGIFREIFRQPPPKLSQ